MRAIQKEARFQLLVIVITVALTAVAALIISRFFDHLSPMGAWGLMGLLGILGFSPMFYHKARKNREVVCDERDMEIGNKAAIHAFRLFWVFFVAVCVVPGMLSGWQGSISHVQLAQISIIGLVIFMAIRSISILVQYRENSP